MCIASLLPFFVDYFIYLWGFWFIPAQRIKPFYFCEVLFYVLGCGLLAFDHILILCQKAFQVCCFSILWTLYTSKSIWGMFVYSLQRQNHDSTTEFYSSHTCDKLTEFCFKSGLRTFCAYLLYFLFYILLYTYLEKELLNLPCRVYWHYWLFQWFVAHDLGIQTQE